MKKEISIDLNKVSMVSMLIPSVVNGSKNKRKNLSTVGLWYRLLGLRQQLNTYTCFCPHPKLQ